MENKVYMCLKMWPYMRVKTPSWFSGGGVLDNVKMCTFFYQKTNTTK